MTDQTPYEQVQNTITAAQNTIATSDDPQAIRLAKTQLLLARNAEQEQAAAAGNTIDTAWQQRQRNLKAQRKANLAKAQPRYTDRVQPLDTTESPEQQAMAQLARGIK